MTFVTNRAIGTTGRAFTRAAVARTVAAPQAQQTTADYRAHLALREADRILRREDVTPEMEPFDPTIESSLKAVVSGDEGAVTITAEDGETITSVTGDDEDVHVEIEDTADVLLGFDARERVTVSGDESEVTITADPGETLYVDEADGAVIVEVDET